MADPRKNFSYGRISVAPTPANSGTTLGVTNADAAQFLDPATQGGAYNVTIWPANQIPLSSNSEIARVTAKGVSNTAGTGHTQLTITRTQESSSARSIQIGDQIAQTITKKTFDDVITDANASVVAAQADIDAHEANVSNPHSVTKAQVDLGSVDNTADTAKPVSTAQQTALNTKENTVTTGTTSQYYRGDKSWQTLDKTAVGLTNVDNTSDANKPVSTATSTALSGKEATITAGTTSQYYRGDKSFQTLDKTAVGLANVDNTSDANKPVSTAQATAIAAATPDATTSVKGKVQLGGDLGGTATAPLVKSRVATVTIGPAGSTADIVCTGTHDGATIKAAVAAAAAGSKIVLRNGTYNFSDSTDSITLGKNGVTLEGESFGGVKFLATAILYPGGGSASRYGMVTIGKSTTLVSKVTLRNIIIDCGGFTNTVGLTLDGGTDASLAGAIGLQGTNIEHVRVTNYGNAQEAGVYVISGNIAGYGANHGYVDDTTFEDLTVDYSANDGIWMYGDYITNVKWLNCKIQYNWSSGIYEIGNIVRSGKNWTYDNTHFYKNMRCTSQSSTVADINDRGLCGIVNRRIDNCTFDAEDYPVYTGVDKFAINIQRDRDWWITNTLIKNGSTAISLAGSQAGSGFNLDGASEGHIENVNIENMHNVWDNDANYRVFLKNVIMKDIATDGWGGYSDHADTHIDELLIYNVCNKSEDTAYWTARGGVPPTEELYKAGLSFSTGGQRKYARNVTIVDDHLLQNPGTATATLTQVAGGAIGATTYYVKYTFLNDSGETLPSAESSLAVSANNLLKVTPTAPEGFNSTYLTIRGVRFINIYVGTTSGAETLQTSLPFPTMASLGTWTMPTSGLVSGAALPVANTTHSLLKYGIWFGAGGSLNTNDVVEGLRVYGTTFFQGIDSGISQSALQVNMRNNWFNDEPMPDNVNYRLGSVKLQHSLATPAIPVLAASASGGSMASGSYSYRFSAIDADGGESRASASKLVSVTGPTGSVLARTATVAGAVSYRIYRGTSLYGESVYFTSSTPVYTDTGAAGTSGRPLNVPTAFAGQLDPLGTSWVANALGVGVKPLAPLHITDDVLVDLTPVRTSDSAPYGVSSASTTANGGNAAWCAFDNDVTSKWTTGASNTTGFLKYDFGFTQQLKGYSITGPISGQSTMGPKTWTFEGSSDNSSWTTLDTQTNVATWSAIEKRIYLIAAVAYRYYRLNVSLNQGDSSMLSVVELELLGPGGTRSDVLLADKVSNRPQTPVVLPNAQLAIITNGAVEYNGSHVYASIGGTRYQLDQQSGSGGTVTTTSIVNTNGFSGSVANASTTPAITITTTVTGLLKGNGTAISAAASGTDYAPATSGSSILKGDGAGGFSSAASNTDYLPVSSPTFTSTLTGPTIAGSSASAGSLTLQSTSHATKGIVQVGSGVLRMFESQPTNADSSTGNGYLFGSSIPSGMITEVSGQILSYGINMSQVGTQDNGRAGGMIRFDTRSGQSQTVILGHSNVSGTQVNRFTISLNTGDTQLVARGGGVMLGSVSEVTPTNIISIDGSSARTIWMERNTTTNTAGNNLTLQASGATSAATDKAGGSLILSAGTATGTGTANVQIKSPTPQGSTNTTDNAPATIATFDSTGMTLAASKNLYLGTAGSGIYVKEGTNATMGVATLVGGTVTVSTTKVTANSRIIVVAQTLGTIVIPSSLTISARTAATSFTILASQATDTSNVAWMIVEPA